jgi:two-component system sensor histidine kinase UhpB
VPLLWRIFAANALVLLAATLLLAVSPATVSFPIALTEAVVLSSGLAVMLALDLALLRRMLDPLRRLSALMRDVDPLRPGERAPVVEGDPEVTELTTAFNEMLARLEDERRDSARRALAAQEAERQRIARELHDEVGQVLTAVILQLDVAGRRAGAGVRDEVEEAREAVRGCLAEVREVARRLRPEALDDLGLGSALAALSNDVTRRTGMRIERRVASDLPALSSEEELVIYRVAQEALTNVVRHAGAGRVALVVDRSGDDHVRLVVEDDGNGFDAASRAPGAGLRGMRERAVLIGASLDVSSSPGSGTTVVLQTGGGRS